MTYRILVVGEGKHFGLSTACLYVTLAGEYGMTGVLEMSRGEYQTETTVRHVNSTALLCVYKYVYFTALYVVPIVSQLGTFDLCPHWP